MLTRRFLNENRNFK
jgi:hypothetical protein